MVELREILKALASRVPSRLGEGLADYAVLRENPHLLPARYVIGSRDAYFEAISDRLGGADARLTYLEFGVYRGESLRAWCALNRDPRSRFVGFDSFEGIPVQWRARPRGYFDVGGQVPAIADPRVRFVKGWFNETLPQALGDLAPGGTILVHIDSDLYSSALYCLTVLAFRLGSFHVMFDEFGAGEGRALRDWCCAFGGSFTPLVGLKRTRYSTLPTRVFGFLTLPTRVPVPEVAASREFARQRAASAGIVQEYRNC